MICRVLIVGLGSIGKRHLRIARDLLPNADIRVLRHQRCNHIPEYSNGCFFNIEEALAFSPQISVVSNPAPFHIATAEILAAAGVHLLIEKPLSHSFTCSVAKLVKTCKENNVILAVGYNLRFLQSLQYFRKLIHEGNLGKILSVRCEVGQYLPSWRADKDYRQGVTANKNLGGGALLELSHEIDYLRWIFGEVEWVMSTLTRQSDLDIDVEDSAHLILGFAPYAKGRQLIGTLNLDLIRQDTTRSCVAIGENGTLRWDGLTGKVSVYREGANEWCTVYANQHQRDETYQAQWLHFLECVTGAAEPIISGNDGLKVLEIIQAARCSAESGGRVNISTE